MGTDLDLLSFLVPMAKRGAVIEIPHYHNRRKVVVRESERKVGDTQLGEITGLTSNQEVFSFSVRIFDQSIAVEGKDGREELGAHHNYMVVDCDGHWYSGWDRIVFKPTAAENNFLKEKDLWTGNTVYFKNYVHPNRWQSVFGAPYLLLKMLLARISEEAAFYGLEAKRLTDEGIKIPAGTKETFVPPVAEGKTSKIQVGTMDFVLTIPPFVGSFNSVPTSEEGMKTVLDSRRKLHWTLKPRVQFVVRADEAAFFRYGDSRVVHWMEGRQWESGYKPPRGRVEWNRMVLSNDVALMFREKTVTQEVSTE